MKLFISQPMAGKTDKEILDERERVIRKSIEDAVSNMNVVLDTQLNM